MVDSVTIKVGDLVRRADERFWTRPGHDLKNLTDPAELGLVLVCDVRVVQVMWASGRVHRYSVRDLVVV